MEQLTTHLELKSTEELKKLYHRSLEIRSNLKSDHQSQTKKRLEQVSMTTATILIKRNNQDIAFIESELIDHILKPLKVPNPKGSYERLVRARPRVRFAQGYYPR